jgi:iron-sulfur cluster assembly 1
MMHASRQLLRAGAVAAAGSRQRAAVGVFAARVSCPAAPQLQQLARLSSAAVAASEAEEHTDAPKAAAPKRKRRELPAPIKLTDRAADRIKQLMASKPDKVGVRLGVKRRGCNGYSYTMNYADEKPPKDEEVADKGVRVFVDPLATFYIVGTTMDWEETELSAEFTFTNPNAKGSCGCGESFNV